MLRLDKVFCCQFRLGLRLGATKFSTSRINSPGRNAIGRSSLERRMMHISIDNLASPTWTTFKLEVHTPAGSLVSRIGANHRDHITILGDGKYVVVGVPAEPLLFGNRARAYLSCLNLKLLASDRTRPDLNSRTYTCKLAWAYVRSFRVSTKQICYVCNSHVGP